MAKGIGALLGGAAFRTETVDLSEWGVGKITVREITGKQQVDLAKRYSDDVPTDQALEFYIDLVVLGVVNDNGEPAYKDEDREQLRDNPRTLLEAIADAVMHLSGIHPDARVDAEKN